MACPPLRKRPRRAARGSLVAAGFSHIDQQEEETAMATDEELREQAIKAWRSTRGTPTAATPRGLSGRRSPRSPRARPWVGAPPAPVSYTHLRAHETRHDLVCRLLLEKKKRRRLR